MSDLDDIVSLHLQAADGPDDYQHALRAAAQLAALRTYNETLREALRKILEICEENLGDYAPVERLYTPNELLGYKDIQDEIPTAIEWDPMTGDAIPLGRIGVFNFRTEQVDFLQSWPFDWHDYLPQDPTTQALFDVLIEQGKSQLEAAEHILRLITKK